MTDADRTADLQPSADATRPLRGGRGTEPLVATTDDLDETRVLDANLLKPPAGPESAGLMAAALRDIGQTRSVNQDSIYALTSTIPREENDLLFGLFIVADGMGGHAAGEIASRIAVTTVVRYVLADLLLPAIEDSFGAALQQVVAESIEQANSQIWDYGRAQGLDLGTTCTVALVLGRSVYVGHVGDSRAYLLENGSLRQLTTDHSAVGRLIEMGALTPEDAREHPLRSQLYRTIGQTPEVQVDVSQRTIGDGTHLLLCSDGLWGLIDDSDLARVVGMTPWPQDACRTLIELANAAGGDDNISAVVVRL
jgi:PPM family protein phosphatase